MIPGFSSPRIRLDRVISVGAAKWPTFRRSASIFVIGCWILLIAFSALVNTIAPTGFGLVSASAKPFWGQFGPISALLLVLLKPLWQATKSDGSLNHIIVSEKDQTDLKQMARYMKRADQVTIYSGEFSYIYDYEPLYEALLDLSDREGLTLISYKSQATVLARSEAKRGTKKCIIRALCETRSIAFGASGQAKFSLVRRRGEEVLLYRHREAGVEYVTVFKATNGMSKQLVDILKTLADIAEKHARGAA